MFWGTVGDGGTDSRLEKQPLTSVEFLPSSPKVVTTVVGTVGDCPREKHRVPCEARIRWRSTRFDAAVLSGRRVLGPRPCEHSEQPGREERAKKKAPRAEPAKACPVRLLAAQSSAPLPTTSRFAWVFGSPTPAGTAGTCWRRASRRLCDLW